MTTRPRLLDEEDVAYQLGLKNRALASAAEGITISDPSQSDNPIVYANAGFERLTGYRVADVLGRNCRFLQGPDTDPKSVDRLRSGIKEEREVTVELLNYRKDGTPFWNRLSVTPVRDPEGTVTHFIGIQSDVTDRHEAEEALRKSNSDLEFASQRMRNDLEAAARVQQALLPDEIPDIGGINVSWAFKPCDELAGDFLNVFALDDEHVAVYVVDVTGHGVAASLLSVTIAQLLTPRVSSSSLLVKYDDEADRICVTSPAEVAAELNRRFPLEEQNELSFTMLYGVLHLPTLEFRYVSAGHDPVIHVRCGNAPSMLAGSGLPIGWHDEPDYEEFSTTLNHGDRLYLYSDGVPEAMDTEMNQFTRERMIDVIQSSSAQTLSRSVTNLLRVVDDWTGNSPKDDISILGIEICEDASDATP